MRRVSILLCLLVIVSSGSLMNVAAVTGTGTANYIAKWTSTTNLANSGLYQNSFGFIGLGTTSPTQKFHITGGNLIVRGVNNFVANGNTATVYVGDNNHPITSLYGGGLSLGVYLHPKALFIHDSSGFVGINTTTPHALLAVNGTGSFAGQIAALGGIKFGDGTTQTTAQVQGPQGPPGVNGQAATVSVGTTTTGAPGTQASVTNSGTSTNAVLNFVIPQGQASPPTVVAKREDTSAGNFVIYVPASNGSFRATVYLESPNGIEQTCASMSWFDDNNNPQTSANVCSDATAKGGFVLPIRAKGGTNIYLNRNGGGAGPVYTILEKF